MVGVFDDVVHGTTIVVAFTKSFGQIKKIDSLGLKILKRSVWHINRAFENLNCQLLNIFLIVTKWR